MKFYTKQTPYLGYKKPFYSDIPLEWFEVKSNLEMIKLIKKSI